MEGSRVEERAGVLRAVGSRRWFSGLFLLLLFVSCQTFWAADLAFAQTKPVEPGPGSPSGSQQPEGLGRRTESTTANPYADAIGQMGEIDNAANVNTASLGQSGPRNPFEDPNGRVDRILTGHYQPLVFQAAEQQKGAAVQKIANNVLNASLGSINDTYRGLHRWWADDLVGNLFTNIGQLIGKWISEVINGWMADTVQFLARFLRIFVLNPNIALNGLDGSADDQISKWIRKGADVMYQVAIDLLLLLFILCIWKYWAEASWRGAGNLMGPVGRLIFTAGLLIAWPTIYALEVQVTNEMIKAVYFDSHEQVAMLHYALATAVKGGVIAGGAAVMSVLAPIASNLLFGAMGPVFGQGLYFAMLIIFLILGAVLIAELVYILVLKAIQTALLTAQYLFFPIFLVFFSTPDTENIATGYVKAFVETSLWTFVWVGLLKVMVIIMFSSYNPWGKILLAVGVLQMMIQVPAFLARAQISPMSDFISAGLVTGGILKGLGVLAGVISGGANTIIRKAVDSKMAEGMYDSKSVATVGLGGAAGDPKHLEGLNRASEMGRKHDWSQGKPGDKPGDPNTPGGKPPQKVPPGGIPAPGATGQQLNTPLGGKPHSAVNPSSRAGTPGSKGTIQPQSTTNTPGGSPSQVGFGAVPPPSKPNVTNPAGTNPTGTNPAGATPGSGLGAAVVGAQEPKGLYELPKSTPKGWDEQNLRHVPVRKLLGKITSVDGAGIRHNQQETGVLGSASHGVTRLNIREGADDAEMARGIYTGAYTDEIAHSDPAKDAARRVASQQKAWKPQGFTQGLIANWMESQGQSWYSTPWAKENFNRAMFAAAVEGSQAYVSGEQGNAYTDYLRGRYGEWGDKQDAAAIHYLTNPESSESPWNRNIGPATEMLVRQGIPIAPDTRGAAQNLTVQGMHPARQKKAMFAVLSYTHDKAQELFGNEEEGVFKLGHGELARSLPAHMVNEAVAIYEATGGQADLKPEYGAHVSSLSSASRQDLPTSYQALAFAAPHVAASSGRLRAGVSPTSIRTMSDLEANIVPIDENETPQQAFQTVMATTSTALTNGELHGVPMRMVLNPQVGRGIYEFMGADILDTASPAAHQKMRVIARNLSLAGTPNNTATYETLHTVLEQGGAMLSDADSINFGTRLLEAGCSPQYLPSAINMGMMGGYHMGSQPIPLETIVEAAHLESQGHRMDRRRVRVVGKLLDAGVSRDILGECVEVAVKGNYAPGDAPLSASDVREIEQTAQQYNAGVVGDTRAIPAAITMARAGIGSSINNQTVRIVAEAVSDLGGHQNRNDNYIRAVVKVAGSLTNPHTAPQVLETYVRSVAEDRGIDVANLPFHQIVNELTQSGYNLDSAPVQIASIQRDGGFSAHQMQDPIAVNLMVQSETAANRAATMQAINVVTRLVGSQEAMQHPETIEVASEYMASGGQVRDFNLSTLQASVAYAAAREAAYATDTTGTFTDDVKYHLRITPGLMKAVQRDRGLASGQGMSAEGWNRIVQEAIRRANPQAPQGP